MTWTHSADIKAIVQKWWDKGELLAAEDSYPGAFPRKVSFKVPTSSETSEKFELVRNWVADLRANRHIRIVMREFRHKTLGKNLIPAEIWIDTADDAFALINKRREAAMFKALLAKTELRAPDLVAWITSNALRSLELTDIWEQLLSVCHWMRANPRPNIYLRQVDLVGVDTKFIEDNRSVLAELFDIILPQDAINHSASGTAQFAQRYGFRSKPQTIRFRMLDSHYSLFPSSVQADIEMDIESFKQFDPKVSRVFITENETNYLAFPDVPDSMVIFGKGYGFEHLKKVRWLLHHKTFYWGDVDSHGLGILNGLRKYLPLVDSILMDEQTVLDHRSMWGSELSQSGAETLQFLSDEESLLYQKLKTQFWQENLRLEQEKINWSYACQRIKEATELAEAPAPNRVHLGTKAKHRLSGADLNLYFRPSKCELRVYFKTHNELEQTLDPYLEAVNKISRQRKSGYLDSIQSQANCADGSVAERCAQTLEAIKLCVPFIRSPLLTVHSTIGGIPVELMCESDLLILGEKGYTLRSVKQAKNVTDSKNHHIILELQLFALLFNMATDMTLVGLEVLNSASELIEIENDGGAPALRELSRILLTKLKSSKPYSPFGWSKCSGCGYNERCRKDAEDTNDVALLVGVDEELAKILHLNGCRDIDMLLRFYQAPSLASIRRTYGEKSTRVGRNANAIIAAAKSVSEKREILLSKPNITESNNYVMLDLEGLPPQFDELDKIYLWGLRVFGTNPSTYMYSLSGFDTNGDEHAWFKFLENSRSVFDQHGDIPFVHWHHYEKSNIEKYKDRYGDNGGTAARILLNLIDLLPITRESFALPLPSYSLKLVEKFVGFTRSQDEYGGTWSMATYIQACELRDDDLRQQLLEKILIYNEEDLEATWAVLQWLKSYEKKLAD